MPSTSNRYRRTRWVPLHRKYALGLQVWRSGPVSFRVIGYTAQHSLPPTAHKIDALLHTVKLKLVPCMRDHAGTEKRDTTCGIHRGFPNPALPYLLEPSKTLRERQHDSHGIPRYLPIQTNSGSSRGQRSTIPLFSRRLMLAGE